MPEVWELLHYGKCAIECFFSSRNPTGKMVTKLPVMVTEKEYLE